MRAFFKYWLPVLLWMGFIFWMSTDLFSAESTSSVIKPIIQYWASGIAPDTVDVIHAVTRKCAHVTEYFILGLLFFRAFRRGSQEKQRSWQWAVISLILVILYAASDELHQSFTATRGASPVDVGIDSMGGMLAQITSVTWSSFKKKII